VHLTITTPSRAARITMAAAFSVCALFAASDARAAGGAFAVDDAEVGAPLSCKVESWGSLADNPERDRLLTVSPACVAPVYGKPVEFALTWQHMREAGDWTSTLGVKAKTNLIPVEPGRLGLGLVGGAGFDMRSGDNTAFAALPLTFQIVEQFKINLNAGWLYDQGDNLHWATWGAGFEWNFVKPVTLIAEVFGQAGHRVDPGSVTEPRAQVGLRFTPVDNLDIDVIYGRNITGADANWITVGVNLRFEPAR
jgi:hypothetical protein